MNQDRPKTTVCKPSHYGSRDELIEDWPHNRIDSSTAPKHVSFSDSAVLRVYPMDPFYEPNKSYSKSDRKEFGRSTIKEAARIKHHLASESHRLSSTDIMKGRLESIGISREEIAGIEHLALTSSPREVIKARQMHAKEILLEQERQRVLGLINADRMASVSEKTAKKATMQARIRAGMAA
mmetsp:Transcript_15241/g.31979  ORF Transcript_15241/g.31979 Transcript_15241/m.31979 type:complete len:181 (-) Transcript_15241:126-668(-)